MLENKPFLIEDIDSLRKQTLNLENTNSKKSELWSLLKKSARNAPVDFGWFVPFTALITQDKQDVENAKRLIRIYIDKLDPMGFCSGLQYHFWCFAFPHAKVCIYFQWLCTINAFSKEEQEEISQKLIIYHFTNFFYGMRSKPEPECVDNQTLSLCLSNTIVGYLFSQGDNPSEMAKIMLRDGKRRLPVVIGDMPVSGYSGEGSSYMDCVNGPAIPLAVELLERITGEQNLLFKEFAPGGGKPVNVLKMVAREFMPGGMLLPWDNYGYQFGVRSALAYGAIKTGDRLFFNALENKCIWTYDIGIGWAYDDLVWTLIWWPEGSPANSDDGDNWFEETVGGTLVSGDKMKYAIQMWDESAPVIPTRAHVNPNAVLFNAFKVPVSADGSPVPGKAHSFQFDDTWRNVGFLAINTESRYNYGDGCLGAHSTVIIDGHEGMRAYKEYRQHGKSGYSKEKNAVYCDTAPIYQENFSDIKHVVRKTTLHCDAFYTVEDYISAENAHKMTSRFIFRPNLSTTETAAKVSTKEGVTLHMQDLLGGCTVTQRTIENHPFKPDGMSQLVDFSKEGSEVRNLFVVFMSQTIVPESGITNLETIADPQGCYTYEEAMAQLNQSAVVLPAKLPPYMEADLPNHKTWWYRKRLQKQPGPAFIKLPTGMWNPQMYLNGQPVDLSDFAISCELVPPHIAVPTQFDNDTELEIVVRVEVPVSHYDGGGDGTVGMSGGFWLCRPCEEEKVTGAEFKDGVITVRTNQRVYHSEYQLMSVNEVR